MNEGTGKRIEASRIVVVMPNWLGDGVMATPFLRGLRGLYSSARIVAVARPLVAPVCRGLDFVDGVKVYAKGEEGAVSRWMRGEKFELGILLPNSLRSAWMMWRGGVKRRVGYAREGRGLLLTDRIRPVLESDAHATQGVAIRAAVALIEKEKEGDGELVRVEVPASLWKAKVTEVRRVGTGELVRREIPLPQTGTARIDKYEPVPAIDYYLELLRYLRGDHAKISAEERRMALGVIDSEREEGEVALRAMGVAPREEFVVMVPGANFGASKCWMPERFAAVAEEVASPVTAGGLGTKVVIASSAPEMGIVEAILGTVKQRNGPSGPAANMLSGPPPPQSMAPLGTQTIVALGKLNDGKGVSVGALKEIVRRARLMICNDTGPRHFAVAFGVPVVTLFGPTDPRWAETFCDRERIVRVDVPCGPCQLKTCPIDHRCMKGITVEMVMNAVRELGN